jgi:hypothetical protein
MSREGAIAANRFGLGGRPRPSATDGYQDDFQDAACGPSWRPKTHSGR